MVYRIHAPRLCAFATALVIMLLGPGQSVALQCHVGTIKFFTEGGIKSCQIEGNHTFTTPTGASLTCRSGELVTQHTGGQIESCTTAAVYTVGATRCEAAHHLKLKPDGSIARCDP